MYWLDQQRGEDKDDASLTSHDPAAQEANNCAGASNAFVDLSESLHFMLKIPNIDQRATSRTGVADSGR